MGHSWDTQRSCLYLPLVGIYRSIRNVFGARKN